MTKMAYRRAMRDALMILGAERVKKDPAAWWCLVELLMSYATLHRS